jgi:hypothetical protein
MTTPGRDEHVAGYVEEIRRHVHHAFGMCVLSDAARDELAAFILLMQTEVAGRSRQISARLEAYWHVLSEARGRAVATDPLVSLDGLVALKSEVDLTTAARMTGVNADTLRRAARERRIEGRVQNNRWLLNVASVEAYKALRAS